MGHSNRYHRLQVTDEVLRLDIQHGQVQQQSHTRQLTITSQVPTQDPNTLSQNHVLPIFPLP